MLIIIIVVIIRLTSKNVYYSQIFESLQLTLIIEPKQLLSHDVFLLYDSLTCFRTDDCICESFEILIRRLFMRQK